MKVSDLIWNNPAEYNGHKQLDISYVPTKQEMQQIISELDELLEDSRPNSELCGSNMSMVTAKLYQDGGWVVQIDDFWGQGEHELGHRDKMLAVFSKDL